jgi:NosR/NirI family nitrous oxide reductase transcriptional regulator
MIETIAETLKATIAIGLVTAGILAILIWVRDLTRKLSVLRLFIQIIASIGIFVILLFWPLPWNPIFSGLIIVSTLIFGRFFCGWLCPFALYMDLLTRLRKSLKIPHWDLPEKLNNGLDILRYIILVSFLALALIFGLLNADVWRYVIMFMGPFKSLIIVFLSPIEPLIEQMGEAFGFDMWGASFHDLRGTINYFNGSLLILLTWIVFFVFTAGSFMIRLLWCRFCPVGATLSILNKFSLFKWAPILHIHKVEEKCTKCGICKRVCPVQVTEVYEDKGGNVTAPKCIHCFRCVEMCPYEECLNIKMAGKTIYTSKNWLKEEEV